MDAQRFNNIVNANFEDFDGEVTKTVSGTPNLMKKVNDDIKKSLSVGDALDRTLATMFRVVLKDLIPHIMKVAEFAIDLFSLVLRFSPAGMLLSVLDGSALQLFKDATGITAKEEKEKQKQEKKRQENFSHDMLAGQMLEDEDHTLTNTNKCFFFLVLMYFLVPMKEGTRVDHGQIEET